MIHFKSIHVIIDIIYNKNLYQFLNNNLYQLNNNLYQFLNNNNNILYNGGRNSSGNISNSSICYW